MKKFAERMAVPAYNNKTKGTEKMNEITNFINSCEFPIKEAENIGFYIDRGETGVVFFMTDDDPEVDPDDVVET